MSTFKKSLLALALLGGVSGAQAGIVDIGGIDIDIGEQLDTTTIWETQITSLTDSFVGVGYVNSIVGPGGAGTAWENGDNDAQLSFKLHDYTIAAFEFVTNVPLLDSLGNPIIDPGTLLPIMIPSAVTVTAADVGNWTDANLLASTSIFFTGGKVDVYVDSTVSGTVLDPTTSLAAIGAVDPLNPTAVELDAARALDVANATDGDLWLGLTGHADAVTGFTLAATGNGTSPVAIIAGVGTGTFDVDMSTLGIANTNYDTNQIPDGSDVSGTFTYNQLNTTAWDLSGGGSLTANAIPEPASIALLGLGLLGLGATKRKKA